MKAVYQSYIILQDVTPLFTVTRENLECPRSFPFMRLLEVIFLRSIERLNWFPAV